MPRYMIVRAFDVTEDMMPAVGLRSRKVIEERYPEIIWEHSHVVVDDEGRVKTYCVYAAPDLDAVRGHTRKTSASTRSRTSTRSPAT